MRKKVLAFLVSVTIVCSPVLADASSGSKSATIRVGSAKSFKVGKGYGKIKKVSFTYPNKSHKGKVSVKRYSGKVKITGKKAGRVKVKIKFSNKKSKTYNITVKSKKSGVVNTLSSTSTPSATSTVSPTAIASSTPIVASTPAVSITPIVTSTPIVTNTPKVSSTPNPSEEQGVSDVEQVDVSELEAIDGQYSLATTNYFAYKNAYIDRYFDKNNNCSRFYIRATTIKNLTDKTRTPDCHVKFYDEQGYLVCEYQNSNDAGATWNKTIKPNEETLILYLAGTSPKKMGVTSEDFTNRVKYWKLTDIE